MRWCRRLRRDGLVRLHKPDAGEGRPGAQSSMGPPADPQRLTGGSSGRCPVRPPQLIDPRPPSRAAGSPPLNKERIGRGPDGADATAEPGARGRSRRLDEAAVAELATPLGKSGRGPAVRHFHGSDGDSIVDLPRVVDGVVTPRRPSVADRSDPHRQRGAQEGLAGSIASQRMRDDNAPVHDESNGGVATTSRISRTSAALRGSCRTGPSQA